MEGDEIKFLESLSTQIDEMCAVRDFLDTGGNKTDIETQFPKFVETYPKLYSGIINDSINLKQLIDYKIEWKELYIETEGTHDDKKYEADKRIGMHLAKIFLFPNKGTPSYSQLKQANSALKSKLNQPIQVQTQEELKKTMTLKKL